MDKSPHVKVDMRGLLRSQEYFELGGPDEMASPFEEAEKVLKDALKDLDYYRNHKHEWGENGFCVICGNDGNA